MNEFARAGAARIFRRALREYGAKCCPVYRVRRDINGVEMGEAEKIGCVYGVRYMRGQTANMRTDMPGVVARMDAPRLSCVVNGCAKALLEGDAICCDGVWYRVLAAQNQMDILVDVVLQEGDAPDGISV